MLELRRFRGASLPSAPTDAGRGISAPDQLHGSTTVHLLDLPHIDEAAPSTPRLLIAAAGASPGWRRADLMISLDQGTSWTAIGSTAAPAIIGTADMALQPAAAALMDRTNSIVVQLLHDMMMLEDADDARLLAGSNLALLGSELFQFGEAQPLGDRRWRLSRLLRGRRGTDWAMSAHQAGERFVLIERDALLAYDPPPQAIGTDIHLLASSLGDASPVQAQAAAIGEALRPPAPVHLNARRRADGGFDLEWVRSSRLGWTWLDGADVPLGEGEERYRLTIAPFAGAERIYETISPRLLYSGDEAAGDLAAGPVTIHVRQVGTGLSSRPAHIVLSA
jgi:hypothetical protein